jgi:Acetyltransferase (GNAT) family
MKQNLPDLKWEMQFLDHTVNVSEITVHDCSIVCSSGFGGSSHEWEEGNRKKLSSSTIFGNLNDSKGNIYGIAYYFIPNNLIADSHLIWEEGICLIPSCQGKGYAKKAVEEAMKILPNSRFQYLCCMTQNPSMFIRYSKYGKRLFPFDELYESSDGKSVINFLCEHIKNLKGAQHNTQFSISNGMYKSFYKRGRLGNYLDDLPGAENFEKKLQEWGFKREEGDSIILALKL